MSISKSWLLFFLIALTQQLPNASAAAPSGKDWFTVKSKNFHVHYYRGLEEYAKRFTGYLENALPKLQADLRWQLPTPVDIIITDPSDSANGFAANFPNTHLEVYSVPFERDSALGHYVNWVQELATHELTHLVANDTTLGFYTTLRSIFGSWVKPNGLQPVWLVEGLAVYEETSFAPGGRGRSPLLEALLRAAVRENKLGDRDYISLDRFNDGVLWWPSGNVPYLMGYTVQAYTDSLMRPKLESVPGHLSFANASRFPYMPNSNAIDVTNNDWYEIFDKTIEHLKKRYTPTTTVATALASPPCQLTKSGRFTGGQALASDGYLYFIDQNPLYGVYLSRLRADSCNPDSIERLEFLEQVGPTHVEVSPNAEWVAYSEPKLYKYEYFYNDLYLYHVPTAKRTRLTYRERASEPAFLSSEDLAYVVSKNDLRQAIRLRNIHSEAGRELFVAAPMERISGLSIANGKIYFSLHHNNGIEQLEILDPVSGSVEAIAPVAGANVSLERNPVALKDGRILFAGFYGKSTQDIYTLNPATGERKLFARSDSGLLDQPRLSSDGKFLFATNYTLQGLEIFRYSTAENLVREIALPEQDLHAYLTGNAKKEIAQEPVAISEPESYGAFSTAATSPAPQYWMPEFSGATDGVLIGASTGGNDALEYHRWNAVFQYDSRANFPVYHFYYLNRSFSNYLLFDAQQYNNYLVSSKSSQRSAQYSSELIIPFSDFQMSLGGAYQTHNLFNVSSHNFAAYYNFLRDTSQALPSAIDPNYGSHLQLYTAYIPSAPSEKSFFDIRPRAAIFSEGFSPAHSLAANISAGISTNHYLSSSYFLGGGASALGNSPYIVRGYPLDALLGQRIVTTNFVYTLPLALPYRGWNTNPLFIRSHGLRFYLDLGSATYLSRYAGKYFDHYEPLRLGQKNLIGTGVDFVSSGSILYHVPISASLGLHYGPMKRYGGGLSLFFGINLGQFGTYGTAQKSLSVN